MGDSWGGEGDEDAWVLAVAIYSRRMGGLKCGEEEREMIWTVTVTVKGR